MEKILFVTDAVKLNMQHLDFACFLCRLTGSTLTGIFLENLEPDTWSLEGPAQALPGIPVKEMKERCCLDAIASFTTTCTARGVQCSTHRDKSLPVNEVINESRYADLIIISAGLSFSDKPEAPPTRFVRSILGAAECPVMIAPDKFDGVNEIVFTYDEGSSSVYAIKQFTYLFPELRDRNAVVLAVREPGNLLNGNKYKLKEWLRAHYSSVELVTAEDRNIRAGLLEHLLQKKRSFIVMGAYGRGALSGFFSPSHASEVVRCSTQPLFITHL